MILSNLLAPMNAPVCDRLWLLDYTQIVRDYGKDLQKMCLTGARCASGAQRYKCPKPFRNGLKRFEAFQISRYGLKSSVTFLNRSEHVVSCSEHATKTFQKRPWENV